MIHKCKICRKLMKDPEIVAYNYNRKHLHYYCKVCYEKMIKEKLKKQAIEQQTKRTIRGD